MTDASETAPDPFAEAAVAFALAFLRRDEAAKYAKECRRAYALGPFEPQSQAAMQRSTHDEMRASEEAVDALTRLQAAARDMARAS